MENKGFDWNSFIGMILIGGILVWFAYTNQGSDEENEALRADTSRTEQLEETVLQAEPEVVIPDLAVQEIPETVDTVSATTTTAQKQLGFFNPVPEDLSTTTLENDVLKVIIAPRGARLTSVVLKDYTQYGGGELELIDPERSTQTWEWNVNGVPVPSDKLFFEKMPSSSDEAIYRLSHSDRSFVEIRYALEDGTDLKYSVRSFGMDEFLSGTTNFVWSLDALKLEKTKDNLQNPTAIYYLRDGDVDRMGVRGDKEDTKTEIEWLAYKQQFFSSILQPDFTLPQATLSTVTLEDSTHTKRMVARMPLEQKAEYSFTYSFVPNQFNTLKAYDKDFDEMIPLGWGIFGWVNRWMVIPVFDFFDRLGWNYGIIILVMAIGIKVVLLPFQYRSYYSMAKMRVLKPELDEINEKHSDNMKKQQAQMELYRKAGVNPLGGCLPMLFQLPFLIALFRFFPASFELRGQGFLWADDLSSYDSIMTLPFSIPFYGDHVSLFTILMATSLFFYTRINQQMTPQSGNSQMQQQMKIIQYIMPFMMLFWFNSYSSGLSYYYFLANVISFGQQFAIRSFIDEDAIHAKLQENKKKEKPKSAFSKRLEQIMKEQQQAQRKKK